METVRKVRLLLFVLLVLFENILVAQGNVYSKSDSIILKAIELSIEHHYDQAEKLINRIIKTAPSQPAGYFFKAAVLQSKMMDYETDNWEQEFFENIHLTLKYAKKQGRVDSESLFYQGSALSYLAFYQGKKGHYLQAIRNGLSGISVLKKLIKLSPDFNDAYYGIGSYKFWRSQIARYFNWLPLISDEREEGLAMVQRAIESGKFTRYAATNAIVWMLLEYKKTEEAFSWAKIGLSQFPDSRFFLWGAAKSAFALKKYNTAIHYFKKILDSIKTLPVNNGYNEYICRLNLARCYHELGNLAEAKNQINALKALELSSEIKKRLRKQRKEINRLDKQISNDIIQLKNLRLSASENNFTNK